MNHFRISILLYAAVLSVVAVALVIGVNIYGASKTTNPALAWGPLPPPDRSATTVAWGPLPPPDRNATTVAWGPLPPPDRAGFSRA